MGRGNPRIFHRKPSNDQESKFIVKTRAWYDKRIRRVGAREDRYARFMEQFHDLLAPLQTFAQGIPRIWR